MITRSKTEVNNKKMDDNKSDDGARENKTHVLQISDLAAAVSKISLAFTYTKK